MVLEMSSDFRPENEEFEGNEVREGSEIKGKYGVK